MVTAACSLRASVSQRHDQAVLIILSSVLCFENHHIVQAVPHEDGNRISFTNSFQSGQSLASFIYSHRHN